MDLIDLKKDPQPIDSNEMYQEPMYSYGLCINLGREELEKLGITLVIGPVFYENLLHLQKVESITFLSLTNKTLDLPKNVISSGINSTSQLNTIKKFLKLNNIKKTIFLTPNLNYFSVALSYLFEFMGCQ